MESSEKRETIPALYWDTFRSWRDRLPEKGKVFNLFCGHGLEQAGLPVTNFPASGYLPADRSLVIKRVAGRVLVSNQALMEKLLQEAVIHLWVGGKPMFQAQLYYLEGSSNQAVLSSLGEPGADEAGDFGGIDLGEGISVPPRTELRVATDFSGMAPRVDQMFHERGPTAEWVEIRVCILGVCTRSLH